MKKNKAKESRPFSERHHSWNFVLGLLLVLILIGLGLLLLYFTLKYIGIGILIFVDWLKNIASKLDAVVIVALITGTVSITGVVISSIISKVYDYKKQRQTYLAQKRENPTARLLKWFTKFSRTVKKKEAIQSKIC